MPSHTRQINKSTKKSNQQKTLPAMAKADNPPVIPSFAKRSSDIHKVELDEYLKKHREANNIEEAPTPDNLSGLCISGGGVRSATLGLGMFQAFIKANKLRYFDYLSTVSGGGYIGACLTSLLSAEPERRDKSWNNEGKEPISNHNTKFDVANVGLEEHNSPFTQEPYEYPNLEDGKMTTKHQLIHLRQHGEYLTPHKSIKDWDVHRLLGALFGGIVANISTFLLFLAVVVLLHHVLLAFMSKEAFIDTLQKPSAYLNTLVARKDSQAVEHYKLGVQLQKIDPSKVAEPTIQAPRFFPLEEKYPNEVWQKMSTSAQLQAWVDDSFTPQLTLVWFGLREHWPIPLAFGGLGVLLALLFIFWARMLPFPTAKREQDEQNFTGKAPNNKVYDRRGEDDMLDLMEQPIIRWFYHIGLWGIPLGAYVVTACLNREFGDKFNYFVMLALPLCYSLGLFLGLHFFIFLYFINSGTERVSGWIYRSFYTGMQGGAFLMVLITALFPIAIIMLFGNHSLAVHLSLSFVPVIVAYYFTMQSLGGKATGGLLNSIINRIRMPLLNLSIFLLVGLTFAWISQGLYALELLLQQNWQFCNGWDRIEVVILLFLIASTMLFLLGLAVNANDVSLHYFYRDRLSEAFLRTSGRVAVKLPGTPVDGPSKLMRINLRNHEDLRLSALGDGNYRAPYHLIVTALNLQGSHDLSAKTLKSEHFLFSKFFIGSRSTGYVSTREYNFGSTKLSTAMAISGAAVSSGMGPLSFAASNFYLTLLNLRTGYWIDNPRHFIREKIRTQKDKAAREARENNKKDTLEVVKTGWTFWHNLQYRWSKLTHKYPFWLIYIWRELTGNMSANSPKINVSDGGHTGDNLGLLPLIQRRCSTIVVADFEADGAYSFDSFGQAVRLAKSIYNVDINIDLTKLMPQKGENGEMHSPASVVEGTVVYNLSEKDPKTGAFTFSKKTGQIIYMKSSISLLKAAAEEADVNTPPPPVTEPAPVMVLNYFKKNPQFPHQTTADQYFDEVQFEAYRMLGEHIGKQAAREVEFKPLQKA